ncbi:MAG: PASTA domain-containing protein [Bacteroidetes bacterium]|nr:MAG: PASTA domain-containing protein [Bacteroidota bacterium]
MKEAKKSILLRTYLVYLGILLFAFAIMSRVIYIQFFETTELLEQAKKQELSWFDVEAIRGNICSDDGTLLATSIPIFDIRMDLRTDSLSDEIFRQNIDSLANRLSFLFRDRTPSQYRDELWEARRNGERYYLIKRKITYPELKELRTFPIFRRGKYKGGLIVIPHYQRELPYKELAKRTIGYESTDESNRVFVGLEGFFSQHLQGVTGQRLMRKVGGESWVPVDLENELEPQNGDDIITTIDINVQDLAEQALIRELIADSADHGCVVVMEVASGQVKAIANLKRVGPGRYHEEYNYAIGESSEPGSTFKLVSFMVALEDGKIDLHMPVATGHGEVFYSGRKMSDSHKGGYGTITAREVFEKSSNVGTSLLITRAYGNNPQKFVDGIYKLGIQKPLGLQISGEGTPTIKDTKDKFWSKLSLPWMSIGYEVALTPLQLLTFYNSVANNGVMVKPLFVKEIRRNGQAVNQYGTEVLNPSVCSPVTLAKLRMIMQGVVDQGTATNVRNPVYKIAGKTGTAQVAKDNRGYGKDGVGVEYKGSFVGFFPVEDPKYSIIVVINNPKKGKYYGASIAAPVFKEISDQLYAQHPEIRFVAPRDTASQLIPYAKAGKRSDLEQLYGTLGIPTLSSNPTALWIRPQLVHQTVNLIPESITQGIMPDVTGMGLRDAIFLLEKTGLMVRVTGKGSVVFQSIAPGSPVTTGTMVLIQLSVLPPTKPNDKKPKA